MNKVSTYEIKLKQYILPQLKLGRKNFDYEHTKAVVYWMKYIIKKTKNDLDPKILITAAYAHDWGYANLFQNKNSDLVQEIAKQKPLHMQRGAKQIKLLLQNKLSFEFTTKQINRISHLVRIHDLVDQLKEEDEISLMEADTLGMLDIKRIKPTFSKKDNTNFIQKAIYGWRLKKFIHPNIKQIGTKLAEQRLAYIA